MAKILHLLTTVYMLVIATSSAASLISYNGYSLDTSTNIVSGGNYEWLQWSKTAGVSVDDFNAGIDNSYAMEGWQLADQADIASLFNDFFSTNFDGAGTLLQSSSANGNLGYEFNVLFGSTWDYLQQYYTQAFYEPNDNSSVNKAYVAFLSSALDRNDPMHSLNGTSLAELGINNNSSNSTVGLALIRTASISEPVVVSEPPTFALFLFGVLVLVFARARVRFS